MLHWAFFRTSLTEPHALLAGSVWVGRLGHWAVTGSEFGCRSDARHGDTQPGDIGRVAAGAVGMDIGQPQQTTEDGPIVQTRPDSRRGRSLVRRRQQCGGGEGGAGRGGTMCP